MIVVNELSKKYGEVTAVKDISFVANSGQVTGFLGPNGAGKTTTMRILTGYSPPTSGNAVVAGYDVFDKSMEVRKRVGYLPENVPLYRDMSARAYLMYIAEIRGMKQRRAHAEEALRRVGLLNRAQSRIKTLSKGMKQRVGLAAALIHDPEVLILDEPTIGLDPIQVLELRDLVKDLGRERTVMFSTHILSEAEQVCDKVVIINRGEILAQGAPAALRSDLERGARVLLRLEEDAETALDTVKQMDLVEDAEIGQDGIIITPQEADKDPRAAIAKGIIEAGFNLLEIRPLAVNLEDIFLELTRRESDTTSDFQFSELEETRISATKEAEAETEAEA